MSMQETTAQESVQSTKGYRLGTVSSILGNDKNLNSLVPSDRMSRGSGRSGLKKFAKSMWFDWNAKRTSTSSVSSNNTVSPVVDMEPLSFSQRYRLHHHRHFTQHQDIQPLFNNSEAMEFNPWELHFNALDLSGRKAPLSELTLSNGLVQLSSKQGTDVSKILSGSPSKNYNEDGTVVGADSVPQVENKYVENPVQLRGRRVLLLKNISPFVGIKSVISQVCGGPLQKIVVQSQGQEYTKLEASQRYSPYSRQHLSIELWFLRPDDALAFYHYTRSGLFLINGFHHYLDWSPQHIPLNSSTATGETVYHDPVPSDIEELMSKHEATRCLVIKKYIRKSRTQARHYPSPLDHFSALDIASIKKHFGEFGDIVEITPMVSKKLCLSIHYFDVEAAIMAKELFETPGDELNCQYKDWNIFYGKDPTDKPTIEV